MWRSRQYAKQANRQVASPVAGFHSASADPWDYLRRPVTNNDITPITNSSHPLGTAAASIRGPVSYPPSTNAVSMSLESKTPSPFQSPCAQPASSPVSYFPAAKQFPHRLGLKKIQDWTDRQSTIAAPHGFNAGGFAAFVPAAAPIWAAAVAILIPCIANLFVGC